MYLNTTAQDSEIVELIKKGVITLPGVKIRDSQKSWQGLIQPSSLDLRVGKKLWAMRGSIRPSKWESVLDLLKRHSSYEFDLTTGRDLQTNCVYIAELLDTINTDNPNLRFRTSPKSSSGRNDLQVRAIVDSCPHYDSFSGPFHGKLYAEILPNSFTGFLKTGTSLNQLRVSLGNSIMSDDEIRSLLNIQDILFTKTGKQILRDQVVLDNGIVLTIDLNGRNTENPKIIGYKARKNVPLWIDLQKKAGAPLSEFFEPIPTPKSKELLLEPGRFYLLSTNEAISIPYGFSGELAQFDPRMGHITTHYAGFFDEGFGKFIRGQQGNTATLEVRAHNHPEIIRDGHAVAVLKMERMSGRALYPYGSETGSNYSRQIGIKPSKHFNLVY